MGGLCRTVLVILTVLYLIALTLFVVGTFGLVGSPQGPLAGLYLIPLGLPWNLMLDGVSESSRPRLRFSICCCRSPCAD